MRAQLVDWMMEVSASFLVRRRTLQTAVNFCDRYLSACPRAFPRDLLQLLGAFFLSLSHFLSLLLLPCNALPLPRAASN